MLAMRNIMYASSIAHDCTTLPASVGANPNYPQNVVCDMLMRAAIGLNPVILHAMVHLSFLPTRVSIY